VTARPWLPHWRARHRRLFTASACIAAACGALLPLPSLALQIALTTGLVGILGLPHGALDGRNAGSRFEESLGWLGMPLFSAGYLALAGLVVATWVAFPAACLLLFLAGAALHFGAEDSERRERPFGVYALEVAARGSLPIVAPVAFHPAAAATLFAWLLPGTTPGAVTDLTTQAAPATLAAIVGVLTISACGSALRERRLPRFETLEPAALVLAAAALPPLLFFALYFCAGHSLRHTLALASDIDPLRPGRAFGALARSALPFTVAALALGAAGFAALVGSGGVGPAAVRVLFVGLAALTLPHVLCSSLSRLAAGSDGWTRAGAH